MIKVDLITGFLGSGKTTFMKKYISYLINQNQKVCILENDYGAVNIDMMLVQDFPEQLVDLEMVSGGCDLDCHKRRFKTKLIAMGMRGYDRVIIEPSGIFDVDEFFDVLYESPLDQWYEIGNVFMILDSHLKDDLSKESNYLLVNQAAKAGKIILSKVQYSQNNIIERTIQHLNQALIDFKCSRKLQKDDFIIKNWDEFTSQDFLKLLHSGYVIEDHLKMHIEEEANFQSLYFMNVHLDVDTLRKNIEVLFNMNNAGNIIRIKGFLLNEGQWYEINATKLQLNIKKVNNGQEVIIVIGEKLVNDIIIPLFPKI